MLKFFQCCCRICVTLSGDHLLDIGTLFPRKEKVGRCCISLCLKSSCCLKICLRQPFMTLTAKHPLTLLCSHFSLYFQLLWMAISLCQLLHAPEGFPQPLFTAVYLVFFSLVFRSQNTPPQNCPNTPFLREVVDKKKNTKTSGINFSVQRV